MSFRFIKARRHGAEREYGNITKKTSVGGREALQRLNSFLDKKSPQVAMFVRRLYSNQQKAITYRELREAVQNGYMDEATLQAWQEDYSRFVAEYLEPAWAEAIKAHAAVFEAAHAGFLFDVMQEGVQSWIKTNSARWVRDQSAESRHAIKAMINYSTTGKYTVDELSRIIRPTIGLTEAQSRANINHYTRVKQNLLKNNPKMREETAEKKAREAAAKYAERQHRYRADTIAESELAYAYNKGMDKAIRQAQAQGVMGRMVRRWITARDGGVCSMCAALDGEIVDMDSSFDIPAKELFPGAHETPPAHPRCRCAVEYVEVLAIDIKQKARKDNER